MRVLILHNRYRHAGGEDSVVHAEIDLLRSRSVEVTEFEMTNDAESDGVRSTVQLGVAAAWSHSSYQKAKELCASVRPDIAHVHNSWMRLSPSVHYACKEAGVPTVQTLHNFRLLCLRADFLRNGKICQDCLGHTPWRGIMRRCYRDSAVASTAVASMIFTHRFLKTWQNEVNAFIALSEYSRTQFIKGGIPSERLFIKRNFLEDAAQPACPPSASNVVLFVGRLSDEKGVDLLLAAWRGVQKANRAMLRIIGDGPMRKELETQARGYGFSEAEVQFTGQLPYARVMSEIGTARALVLPSLCVENCPRTLLEAFCNGRPAIVPNRGSLDELLRNEETGLKFSAGDESSLSETLRKLLSPYAHIDIWGKNARREYLTRYTPDTTFEALMKIYQFAGAKDLTPAAALETDAQAAKGVA